MARFSNTSQLRLDSCHPDLVLLFTEVVKDDDCTIICGFRTKTEQNQAFEEGKSKVQWPDGNHNILPSLAVDVAPYFPGVGIDWSDTPAFALFAGKVIAKARQLREQGRISHSITWGGDWDSDGRTKDHQFMDGVHFELSA